MNIKMYKKISDLTDDELKKVFALNSELQRMVFDEMWSTAQETVEEYLECWEGGIDYCIGYTQSDYFAIDYPDMFLAGLEKAQQLYNLLPDSVSHLIEKARYLSDRYDIVDQNDDEVNCDRVQTKLNEVLEDLRRLTYQALKSEYEDCFSYDNQEAYFIEYYLDSSLSDSCFIDKNYTLYQPIRYIKSFK